MPDANEGLVAILSKLDEDTIFALAQTVTQGLKKSRTAEEAVQNIMKYSPDELSILRRKLVTKEILFVYLDENNVKIRLPITKNELIDAVADLWNIPRVIAHSQENSVSIKNGEEQVKSSEDHSVNQMANQFSKWFYSMLNDSECGPEHFFADAKLKLNMFDNEDCDTTIVEKDPEEIKNALLKTRKEHDLFFNLNDTQDGIQGRVDPHGLVMVLACGTLHVKDICAGVFEQVFALARDPFSENNWKIKNTELNLHPKSHVLGPPKLCDNELTVELLRLPSD